MRETKNFAPQSNFLMGQPVEIAEHLSARTEPQHAIDDTDLMRELRLLLQYAMYHVAIDLYGTPGHLRVQEHAYQVRML
jgi:hypothetical protein